MKKNILELLKNRKLVIIIGTILAIAIIVTIIVLANSGTTRYAKKLKNYLVKVGYNCDGVYQDEEGVLDTDGEYIYCQMTTSNGIYKEMLFKKNIKKYLLNINFTNTVYDTYKIMISSNAYVSKKHKGIIRYKDEIENHTFQYYAPNGGSFNIGDQVNCNDEISKYKEACEDDAKDVAVAMREFESYFLGSGLKLK